MLATDSGLVHVGLFAGIGGFELAAKWAGFTTQLMCEIDPFCQSVLRKNFPGIPIVSDIHHVTTDLIRQYRIGSIDLLTGGFPCQDVSQAGNREGLGGARSGLWSEMQRVIHETRPSFIVVENVPGLFYRGFDRVLSDLSTLGHDAEWGVFSACQHEFAHTRERVFIVAYPCGKRCEILTNYTRTKTDSLEGMGERSLQKTQRILTPDGRVRMQVPEHLRVCNGVSAELDIRRIHACGNAIVPQVAYPILAAIAEQIQSERREECSV